jgi:alpha-tubulin suppressor-like RCC1 family protein
MSSRRWRSLWGIVPIPLLGCSLLVDTSGLLSGPTNNVTEAPSDGGGSDGKSPTDGSTIVDPDGGSGSSKVLLAAGGSGTCAARGASIWCWGDNASGQIGDGTMTKRLAPAAVIATPGGDVTALGVGETHACAVIAHDVYCWGSGGAGQLGDGRKVDSATPVKVAGLPAGRATQVSAGTSLSCGVADGAAFCWGTNGSGQLGNPVGAGAVSAVSVVTASGALTGVVEVASGQDHACARLTNGDVYCWGHNDNGTLGSSTVASGAVAPKAVKVEGLPGPATKVAIAGWHACVIIGGAVWCWGTGTAGELGNGGSSSTSTPVAATGLGASVTTLAIGGGPADGDATCAVRAGEALCWGNNQSGRLGDGLISPRGVASAVVSLPTNVVDVAAGLDHGCALLASGEVRCWGRGTSGQLGDGAGVDRATPVVAALPP